MSYKWLVKSGEQYRGTIFCFPPPDCSNQLLNNFYYSGYYHERINNVKPDHPVRLF